MNNMKKTYITPNIRVLATELENSLLYVSGETQSKLDKPSTKDPEGGEEMTAKVFDMWE